VRTIVDGIVQGAYGRGSLTVLGVSDGSGAACLSWAQVHDRARRTAAVLAAYGVRRGSRVGLLGDTGLGLVIAAQAVWLAGGSITMLPPVQRSRMDAVSRIVADAGFDLVLTDSGPLPSLGRPGMGLADLERVSLRAAPAEPAEIGPDDLAVLQYTSGSTRQPRGVPVTHGNLAANIVASRAALGHDRWHSTPMMSWLPLFHDMGLIGFLAFPMSCGCPLVLQSPLAFARRPVSWLEALSRYRAAVTGAPNFAYRLLVPLLSAGLPVDLRSVRLMLCGGEPIDPGVLDSFAAAAYRNGLARDAIAAAYGLAEATLAVTLAVGGGLTTDVVDGAVLERDGLALPAEAGKPLVRLGTPIPGMAVRIASRETGEVLAERRVGRIEVSGPSVTALAVDGWLDTGDLGYLAGGELVVCGRVKDVLFAAGRNIHPQDIEYAAHRVHGVRSAIAFGVPGDGGDRIVVAIETRGSEAARVRTDVAAAVVGAVGVRPSEVVTVPAGRSPRTSSGKPRRAEARRRYLSGELFEKGHVR